MATKAKSTAERNGAEVAAGRLNAPATMRPEIVTFHVVGMTALLQNNPASFIGETDDGALGVKKKYVDEEEAANRCYQDDEGNYVHPAESFKKAMIKAVTGLKFGKKSAPGIILGNIFIAEPWCLIEDGKGKPAKKYTIDKRSVVNPTNKARVMRCRPSWSPWQMSVALEIDTALISADHVRDALSLAGHKVGIGDFRPEKKGPFGRFYVR